jgi:hypothetical protein
MFTYGNKLAGTLTAFELRFYFVLSLYKLFAEQMSVKMS